jgi:hypothetical protein
MIFKICKQNRNDNDGFRLIKFENPMSHSTGVDLDKNGKWYEGPISFREWDEIKLFKSRREAIGWIKQRHTVKKYKYKENCGHWHKEFFTDKFGTESYETKISDN